MMKTMNTEEMVQIAKEMGFTHWLGQDSNRGWYTCEITGKKFRGQEALDMLGEQAQAMAERQQEIEEAEFLESDAAAEQAEKEDEEFGKMLEAHSNKKRTGIASTTFHHPMPEGGDTLGVLHANGMIDKITERLAVHLEEKMVEAKTVHTVTIKCADCDEERIIKVQDAFQVKRCVGCQKKHRNKQRAARRREQRAERKAAQQEQE